MWRVLAAIGVFVATLGLVAEPSAQRGAAQGRGSGQRGRGGNTDGVEVRTYRFPETNEPIEYDTFVSHRVDKKKKSPLVIALHGMSVPPLGLIRFLTDAADRGGYIVAAPTGYNLQGWYGANGPSSPTTPENLGELSEKDVMNVLALMLKNFNIDDRRIYLLGQSMGGGGAMHLGVKYSGIWAAIGLSAPAMSVQQPAMLESIRNIPVILLHGASDTTVPLARIQPWVDKMRELQMVYEYDELRGVGHSDTIENGASRIFAFFDKHSKPAPSN